MGSGTGLAGLDLDRTLEAIMIHDPNIADINSPLCSFLEKNPISTFRVLYLVLFVWCVCHDALGVSVPSTGMYLFLFMSVWII